MLQKILVWLTAVYMFFAGLFGFGPKKPNPGPPTQADYVEVLEALKEAFATGEYQAFVERYPPNLDKVEHVGDEHTAWPFLLDGVTADMTYSMDDFEFYDYSGKMSSSAGTVSLQVKNGNVHLPSGRQTVWLQLEFCNGLGDGQRGVALYSMALNTDGRWAEFATDELIEHQIYLLAGDLAVFAHTPLMQSICFLNEFDPNDKGYTAEEIIAAAKKYLGVDYTLAEIEKDREGDAMLSYDKHTPDRYSIEEGCILGPIVRVKLLGANKENNLTCRAFIYANWFLLEIKEIKDYTFRILKNPDGAEYAQLLSVTTVS